MIKLLMMALGLLVASSLHATPKKVKMYDVPNVELQGGMRYEVPTTVTYQGDSIHVASDSLLTNATIVVRSVSGEILMQRENQTVGTTPLSYFVNNIGNRFFTIEISTNNTTYSGSSYVYLKPEVAAFIYNQSYIGDTISYYIRLMDTGIEEDKSWDMYVDENPNAPWPHSMFKYHTTCYQFDYESVYFSFDESPTFSSESELSDCQKFSSYAYGNNCNLKPSVTVSNITNSAATNTYAIIMGGGTNKYNNSEEYWNDCSLMYQTLVNKYKIPKNNVQVYFGAGTDSIPTIRRADWQGFKVMSKDLDNDGGDDIVGPSNTSLFINALSGLNSLPDADKAHVFVFFIGEGGTFNKGSFNNPVMDTSIQFWEDETPSVGMWYDHASLESLLQDLSFNSLNMFFGQDSSTAFLNGFQDVLETVNSDLSCVLTASSNGANNYCENKPYHEFAYNWSFALNLGNIYTNNAPGGLISPISPTYLESTFDINMDGHVTMNEAYSYANNNTSSISSYYASPDTLFSQWAFTTISPAIPDLYVRDFNSDSGAEPSANYLHVLPGNLSSPDIYTRNINDGFTNQTNQLPDLNTPGGHSYFYTNIHNRGLEEYVGEGKYIHAYWFIPSSYGMGGLWQSPISSSSDFGLIGIKEVDDSIGYCESNIEEIYWQIPGNMTLGPTMQLGYLVELTDDYTPHAQTVNSFKQLYSKVFKSNDITYRKMMYANVSPHQLSYSVDLTRGEEGDCEYEIIPDTSARGDALVEETDNGIRVFIEFDDNSEGEQMFHVIQKSTDTGDLKDELTLCVNRTNEKDAIRQKDNSIIGLSNDAAKTNLTIQLQNPAAGGTEIKVESVTTTINTQSFSVNEGMRVVQIPVTKLTDGFYNVSLMMNGECIDTKKIY